MIYLALWNALVFLIYGWDKLMAIRKGRRVPEFWLLSVSLLAGGLGGIFGMVIFRHKTNKWRFRLIVPLSLLLTVFILIYVI
ncbi:MAG: DUF1294 domain-containing protein [Clostridia bacterium]|nr:DUF1294 domain-containing protein [Clostridia bacterium]